MNSNERIIHTKTTLENFFSSSKLESTRTNNNNINLHETHQKISQIKYDKNFVNKILEKLKVGNSRSIHLNAIPANLKTRLDLYDLENVEQNMPKNFIDTILNKDIFSFQISYDKINLGKLNDEEKNKLQRISTRLNNIVIENDDSFLEFGLKNFGFGYPLLIKRDRKDPEKIIKAPLIIWNLDIERSFQKKNTWTIKKEEDSSIKINELLISHLSKDESIKMERITNETLEEGFLDKNNFIKIIKNILAQLNIQTDNLETRLERCLDAKQIESIQNSKPWIQWSGIFGIYRSQNETIIHATEELLERLDEFQSEELKLEPFQTSTLSAVETDPSQEEIVNTLTKDEIKLIQGPPGTGKSQSITAIISNALSNNSKCLIVCEKKTALDVIQANLDKIGLGDYSIIIDDVNKDRKKVIEKARRIKDSRDSTSFSKLDFDEQYKKFCQLKREINSKHAEALKKVFGDFAWNKLIGLYLKYSKSGDIKQITSVLDYGKLKFNHDEYSKYLNFVEDAANHFYNLGQDSEESFQILNNSLFSIKYNFTTHEKIRAEMKKFHNILNDANLFLSKKNQTDCEEKGISLFQPESIQEFDKYIGTTIKSLDEIIDLCERFIELDGDKFKDNSFFHKIILNINALFDAKQKEICKIKKKIPSLMNVASESCWEIENRFSFVELGSSIFEEIESYDKLKEDCSGILAKIKEIESQIKNIREIENQIKIFEAEVEKIKGNGIFDFKFSRYYELGNHESVCEFHSELLDRINKIQFDLYESYHEWKFFCYNRDEFELQILSVFKQFPSKNWKHIFMAWYYYGALLNYEENTNIGFHKSDSQLKQLTTIYDELSKQQIQKIRSIWGNNRKNKLNRLTDSFNFNAVYNLRKNNLGPKNSLRRIIEKDFDLFTTLFPVILTNPIASNAILPLKQGIFNVVIFDEASQLRICDTFTSLIRGQFKIIAGDEHQMPPSNYFQSTAEMVDSEENENDEIFSEEEQQKTLAESESLLHYCANLQNVNKSPLDFHYRSKHPSLIEFSNNAFYGGNLISFPPKKDYKPIEFRAINGKYVDRTNQDEVKEILKIIEKEIHPEYEGKYPSIGIATFNINQRNLIKEELIRAEEKNPIFAKKLSELRERGLWTKNLENIQGDERDIIIISTTYGKKPDGKFSQNFARLNRIEGYKLLNVLITRAKYKLYVCTSIPKEYYLLYHDLIKNEDNNKKGILYAYLAYTEAISNGNKEESENILNKLKEQSREKPKVISNTEGLSESPFEEEVYELLLDHFNKDKIIQQHKVGGFRLDFVIKTSKKEVILECDGKTYHSSEEAYAWDMYRQKELENMGYVVYRIWSTNWFHDKDAEMRKLLRFIESLETN